MEVIKKIIKKISLLLNKKAAVPPFLIKNSKFVVAGVDSFHNGGFVIKGGESIVKIGNYCAFGNNVKIIKSNHNYNFLSTQYSFYNIFFSEQPYTPLIKKKPTIIIGNNVWIGDNVIILPNVEIGEGVCIGAGSVVTKSINPYTIVGGVPAKKIKMRYSEQIINKLLQLDLWNWSRYKILNNKELFFTDFNTLTESKINQIFNNIKNND